jgi:hypothetical protein
VILPQQASTLSGASVVLVDFPAALEGTATVGADGTALYEWDAPNIDYFFRIERITTFVTGNETAYTGACYLYEGDAPPTRIRDGSSSPELDIADESSPITIHSSMPVIMQWVGLTPGAQVSASIQYQLWRRLNGGGSGGGS